MDTLVKRGSGYGNGYGYGYGSSKPQLSYHRQDSERVTTVVTEIKSMTVNNEKASCDGDGAVEKQQQASCKEEEAFQEHADGGSYSYGGSGYHGAGAVAGAVQKSFKQEVHEGVDVAAAAKHGYNKPQQQKCGEADAAHYGGAGVKKNGYNQEEYGAHSGGAGVKEHGYKLEEKYGEAGAGYAAHYGGAGVKEHGYKQGEKYGEAGSGYNSAHYGGAGLKEHGGYRHGEKYREVGAGYSAHHGGAGVKEHGYKAYGETDVGCGAHYGGGAVQTYAYDQQTAYGGAISAAVQQNAYRKKDAYGGGAVRKDGSRQEMYGEADAGYGAHYGGGIVRQNGYHQKDAYGGGAVKNVKKSGYHQYQQGVYGEAAGTGCGGDAVQMNSYDQQLHGYNPAAYGYNAHGKESKNAFVGGYGCGYESMGKAGKTECSPFSGAGGYNYTHEPYRPYTYESESEGESESESESESDCEEAFPPRVVPHGDGVQGYHGYGWGEKNGGGNLGGCYESYGHREGLGGGHRYDYESYQSTTQQMYTGRGGRSPPRKNRFPF